MFAIVLVTLTGARRSGGGGCDDDNGSSSSSSSGGGFTSGGTTTGGDDTTTTTVGGTDPDIPSFSATPTETAVAFDEDVRDETTTTLCDYNESTSQLTSSVTVTNMSTTDSYNYSITVKWVQTEYGFANGPSLGTDFLTTTLSPGQSTTLSAEFPYFSQEAITFECSVDTASKSIAS